MIFKDEGVFGATVQRPALTRCLKALRSVDTLIVWKRDRLDRGKEKIRGEGLERFSYGKRITLW
jgi:DNA invertase Pin-like site-specific DNA recombinase